MGVKYRCFNPKRAGLYVWRRKKTRPTPTAVIFPHPISFNLSLSAPLFIHALLLAALYFPAPPLAPTSKIPQNYLGIPALYVGILFYLMKIIFKNSVKTQTKMFPLLLRALLRTWAVPRALANGEVGLRGVSSNAPRSSAPCCFAVSRLTYSIYYL